jgi:hypothetical protein
MGGSPCAASEAVIAVRHLVVQSLGLDTMECPVLWTARGGLLLRHELIFARCETFLSEAAVFFAESGDGVRQVAIHRQSGRWTGCARRSVSLGVSSTTRRNRSLNHTLRPDAEIGCGRSAFPGD